MDTFIINLNKSSARKDRMETIMSQVGLTYSFFNAMNGKELSEEYLHTIVYDYENAFLSRGAIGCTLSHLSIYKKMFFENIEHALILEDDVVFPEDTEAFKNIIENIVWQDDIKEPNIYLLNDNVIYYQNKILHTNIHQVYEAVGSSAYVINLAAAKSLLKLQIPLKFEVDYWRIFIDREYANIYTPSTEDLYIIAYSDINPDIKNDISLSATIEDEDGKAYERYQVRLEYRDKLHHLDELYIEHPSTQVLKPEDILFYKKTNTIY